MTGADDVVYIPIIDNTQTGDTDMTKTEAAAIKIIVKTGFSFYGDSFFASFASAKRCLDGLVRKGYAVVESDDFGKSFKPTEAAKDFVTYGIKL